MMLVVFGAIVVGVVAALIEDIATGVKTGGLSMAMGLLVFALA